MRQYKWTIWRSEMNLTTAIGTNSNILFIAAWFAAAGCSGNEYDDFEDVSKRGETREKIDFSWGRFPFKKLLPPLHLVFEQRKSLQRKITANTHPRAAAPLSMYIIWSFCSMDGMSNVPWWPICVDNLDGEGCVLGQNRESTQEKKKLNFFRPKTVLEHLGSIHLFSPHFHGPINNVIPCNNIGHYP